MAERGRIRSALLAGALGLAGLAAAGCGEIAGEPRPVLASIDDGDSPGGPAVASVDELDLCELLTPADFPVAAAPGDEPLREVADGTCVWTVSIDNAVGTFSAGVSARRIVFRDFVPPPGSPNGRAAEIDVRDGDGPGGDRHTAHAAADRVNRAPHLFAFSTVVFEVVWEARTRRPVAATARALWSTASW